MYNDSNKSEVWGCGDVAEKSKQKNVLNPM